MQMKLPTGFVSRLGIPTLVLSWRLLRECKKCFQYALVTSLLLASRFVSDLVALIYVAQNFYKFVRHLVNCYSKWKSNYFTMLMKTRIISESTDVSYQIVFKKESSESHCQSKRVRENSNKIIKPPDEVRQKPFNPQEFQQSQIPQR